LNRYKNNREFINFYQMIKITDEFYENIMTLQTEKKKRLFEKNGNGVTNNK